MRSVFFTGICILAELRFINQFHKIKNNSDRRQFYKVCFFTHKVFLNQTDKGRNFVRTIFYLLP